MFETPKSIFNYNLRFKYALRVPRAVTRSLPYYSRAKVDRGRIGPPPPLDHPRRNLFSHRFSFPFLTQLRSAKASLFDPFGGPDRAKIVPRRLLRPLLFKNVDFYEIV